MRARELVKIGVVMGLAAVLLGGCQFGSDMFQAKFTRSEELTAPLDGVTVMDVKTNVGGVRIDAADVTEARIQAEIKVKARTEERAQELAEQVRISADRSGQTLRIRAIRPAGLKDDHLSVNYTITAPASLALKCETNVGDIRTAGCTGKVESRTGVGDIACTGLQGNADLQTNVGDIRADYASDAPAAVALEAVTNVGSIELAGPRDISAKLAAETNVGGIESDRPLTVTGPLKRSIQASLGNAEGRINLRTNVGSIRIR